MKAKVLTLVVLLSFVISTGYSQEKSRKELKEERKIERQNQIEVMINAKEFVFIGKSALPNGMRSVNLTGNSNYVKFQPDLIDSNLPFFGRAYSGTGYGGDNGLKFIGKPDEFTVVKNKKGFQINAAIKGEGDNYRLSLLVGFEGSASLSIISNNRSSMLYNGEILPPEKPVN